MTFDRLSEYSVQCMSPGDEGCLDIRLSANLVSIDRVRPLGRECGRCDELDCAWAMMMT